MWVGEAGGKLVASLTEPEATQLEAREGGGWLIELLLLLLGGGVVEVVEVGAVEYEALGHLRHDFAAQLAYLAGFLHHHHHYCHLFVQKEKKACSLQPGTFLIIREAIFFGLLYQRLEYLRKGAS